MTKFEAETGLTQREAVRRLQARGWTRVSAYGPQGWAPPGRHRDGPYLTLRKAIRGELAAKASR